MNVYVMGTTCNFTRAKIFGLLAGFLIYLLTLFTGIFLTFLHYYYCLVICVLALICWLFFMYGAVTRSQSYAALIMILFAIGCEIVFIVLIGLFAHFMSVPEKGPLCKLSDTGDSPGGIAHPGGDFCSSKSNLAVVCVFSAAVVIVLICIELLRRFRAQLLLLNQQTRNARSRSVVSLQTCINNARRQLDQQDPASSCFYVFDPSTRTMRPSQVPDYPSTSATSAPGRMLSPPTYLEAISGSGADDAPPDYNSIIKGTMF